MRLEQHSLDSRSVDDFRITAMLCDAVHVTGGKLYILGGGWNQIPAQPIATAIAFVISIPWTEANKQHILECRLVDENGSPFKVKGRERADGPETDVPFGLRIPFESGRPPGARAGAPLTFPMAAGVPPLPYTAGRFEFTINGQPRDDWRVPFEVKPVQQAVFYPGKN
jgi:hypothetical protein